MAIYHLTVKIIGRNSGRSSVAAAAYRSGDVLTNEWDGITHDYSKKGWIEHTEIILPEHAPAGFKDRNTLWNAVETAEKSGNAQLAREVEIALPIELSREQQITLIRDYIQENFVSQGMCADFAIHNPPVTDGKHRPIDAEGQPTNDKSRMIFQNPHAHILLTMRPLDEQGNWQPKYQAAYLCRKDNTELAIPATIIKQAEAEGWRKQYQYRIGKKSVWLTAEAAAEKDLKRIDKQPKKKSIPNSAIAEWNSKDTLFRWRESWASMCNQALKDNNIDVHIDHRSYAEQEIDKIPSVHLGPYAYRMEKQGIRTELGDLNRRIQSDNIFLSRFEKQIEELEKKETERIRKTAVRLETLRANHIAAAYQQFCFSLALAQQQNNSQVQIETVAALAKTVEQMMAALETLTKILAAYERQLKQLNPVQRQKKKELKEKITETEKQIQGLRERLNEAQNQQEQIKSIPASDPEILEQKKKQIEHLKEIQSQTYKEFYTLIKENKENMAKIRELIRGSRHKYDTYIKEKITEHYAENFKEDILERAKEKAPDILDADAGTIRKNISHKR